MIETERLRLRRLSTRDVDAYTALIGSPEVMRFIGSGQTRTREDAADAIAEHKARYDRDGFGLLAVERRSDRRFIGRVGFFVWNRRDWTGGWTRSELGEDAAVELGWALLSDAWGSGYATEAAAAMRTYGLVDLDLSRLISLVHPDNERSLAVAKRLGAIHETDVETARWGPARLYVHRVPATLVGGDG